MNVPLHKAIIVSDVGPESLDELNALLKDGWIVQHTCAMPSSSQTGAELSYRSGYEPTCLVVLRSPPGLS